MKWNVAAECISTVMLGIIWFYARKGSALPSLRNKLFQICLVVTFCAMVFNILSTVMIDFSGIFPVWSVWLVTTVYFAATPLMGLAYYLYAAATVYEKREGLFRVVGWGLIPGVAYLFLVLGNPLTKWLFDFSREDGYIRGPLILTTYVVFYIYCLLSVLITMFRRKWLERQILLILAAFPIIAGVVILIQQLFPTIILSGSAATSALLIIYLYLQNKQITVDYLTNLPNRQALTKMLELQLRRFNCPPFALMVLSLRDFKQINDKFGQKNGDAILQAISSYLHTLVDRQSLYRFSGDEFALMLWDVSPQTMKRIFSQMEKRMETPWETKEVHCVIRGVIGVVQYPHTADSLESLIHGIEYAVSRAKASKAEPVCYCSPEMIQEIQRRTQIAEILRDKLETDSFVLYYQPIFSHEQGRFVLAESLLRIPDSPLGPLFPSEFIPIAEETGLIVEMTYQILGKVCRLSNRLKAEGIPLEGIHVNFSAVQFTQKDLVNRVFAILAENGTPFDRIKIEITESVLAENSLAVVDFAQRMHEKGVLLGLDDFGTGYSNIVSVMNTPLDTVKIDKSLIWSAMENERSSGMLKSLVHVFHEMGLRTLAEGVETREQDRFTAECGIDLIQGYYYARPMPEEETVKLLKAGVAAELLPEKMAV